MCTCMAMTVKTVLHHVCRYRTVPCSSFPCAPTQSTPYARVPQVCSHTSQDTACSQTGDPEEVLCHVFQQCKVSGQQLHFLLFYFLNLLEQPASDRASIAHAFVRVQREPALSHTSVLPKSIRVGTGSPD